MKPKLFSLITFFLLLLAGCKDNPMGISYRPVLPSLPGHWEELLGQPHWRLEWINETGTWHETDIAPDREAPEIPLIHEWASPVLAWPFWPEWNLDPGMMRPSGALFPWDASNERISLSWKGGAEAVFWKELAASNRSSPAGRLPWYFDWPRFRELLENGAIPEAVRQDPWIADWRAIALITVQSGFDRRRIVPRQLREIAIPGLDGQWIGSSPFASPLDASPDGDLLLKAADTPDTWVSAAGILKCSVSGWVFIPHL